MARQFLSIPAASATAERVFSFAGLTLSDLHKSLVEGTLEVIMWVKWGSPSIQLSVIYGVTVTVCTSFIFKGHRETDHFFFTTSGVQVPTTNSGLFHFLRVTFSS